MDIAEAVAAPIPSAMPAEIPSQTMPKAQAERWLQRIKASEKYRDTFTSVWQENVRARKQSSSDGNSDRLSVPEDWARTKQKAAQLAYKLPRITAMGKTPEFDQRAALVTADLNDVLRYECQAHYMIDECLADGINAAGLMVSEIGLERQTEEYEIEGPPVMDVSPLGELTPSLAPPPMQKVKRVVSQKITWDRRSPMDFVWPAEFRSSHWDQAPWLGTQVSMLVGQAKKTFVKLPPDFKAEGSRKPKGLTDDVESTYTSGDDYVRVTTLYYRAWLYDEDKKHPDCIRKVVFVEGYEEPVEFGDCDWQKWVEATPERPGYYLGLKKFPIRVETLVYVSDSAVPPSDSEAGRPQVRELMKSRSQMLRQRDHSIPLRWFNPNLVDDEIAEQIRRGTYQDMIPVNGDGTRMMGELARANYPRENFEFQTVIGNDLDRSWSQSSNQLSQPNTGERSAREVAVIQGAGQIRLEYEKGRVNRKLVEGAEVVFSLMQMFRDGTKHVKVAVPEGGGEMLLPVTPQDLQGEFLFDFVIDSSDYVDVTTRQNNLLKLYNLAANDPNIDRKSLLHDLVLSHGLDPNKHLLKETPEKAPEKPNVSFRFSGEDLLNPMAVALMLQAYPIGPLEIKAASLMIQDAVQQIGFKHPQPPPGAPAGPGGAPMQAPEPIEPPETNAPILKRGESGTRF